MSKKIYKVFLSMGVAATAVSPIVAVISCSKKSGGGEVSQSAAGLDGGTATSDSSGHGVELNAPTAASADEEDKLPTNAEGKIIWSQVHPGTLNDLLKHLAAYLTEATGQEVTTATLLNVVSPLLSSQSEENIIKVLDAILKPIISSGLGIPAVIVDDLFLTVQGLAGLVPTSIAEQVAKVAENTEAVSLIKAFLGDGHNLSNILDLARGDEEASAYVSKLIGFLLGTGFTDIDNIFYLVEKVTTHVSASQFDDAHKQSVLDLVTIVKTLGILPANISAILDQAGNAFDLLKAINEANVGPHLLTLVKQLKELFADGHAFTQAKSEAIVQTLTSIKAQWDFIPDPSHLAASLLKFANTSPHFEPQSFTEVVSYILDLANSLVSAAGTIDVTLIDKAFEILQVVLAQNILPASIASLIPSKEELKTLITVDAQGQNPLTRFITFLKSTLTESLFKDSDGDGVWDIETSLTEVATLISAYYQTHLQPYLLTEAKVNLPVDLIEKYLPLIFEVLHQGVDLSEDKLGSIWDLISALVPKLATLPVTKEEVVPVLHTILHDGLDALTEPRFDEAKQADGTFRAPADGERHDYTVLATILKSFIEIKDESYDLGYGLKQLFHGFESFDAFKQLLGAFLGEVPSFLDMFSKLWDNPSLGNALGASIIDSFAGDLAAAGPALHKILHEGLLGFVSQENSLSSLIGSVGAFLKRYSESSMLQSIAGGALKDPVLAETIKTAYVDFIKPIEKFLGSASSGIFHLLTDGLGHLPEQALTSTLTLIGSFVKNDYFDLGSLIQKLLSGQISTINAIDIHGIVLVLSNLLGITDVETQKSIEIILEQIILDSSSLRISESALDEPLAELHKIEATIDPLSIPAIANINIHDTFFKPIEDLIESSRATLSSTDSTLYSKVKFLADIKQEIEKLNDRESGVVAKIAEINALINHPFAYTTLFWYHYKDELKVKQDNPKDLSVFFASLDNIDALHLSPNLDKSLVEDYKANCLKIKELATIVVDWSLSFIDRNQAWEDLQVLNNLIKKEYKEIEAKNAELVEVENGVKDAEAASAPAVALDSGLTPPANEIDYAAKQAEVLPLLTIIKDATHTIEERKAAIKSASAIITQLKAYNKARETLNTNHRALVAARAKLTELEAAKADFTVSATSADVAVLAKITKLKTDLEASVASTFVAGKVAGATTAVINEAIAKLGKIKEIITKVNTYSDESQNVQILDDALGQSSKTSAFAKGGQFTVKETFVNGILEILQSYGITSTTTKNWIAPLKGKGTEFSNKLLEFIANKFPDAIPSLKAFLALVNSDDQFAKYTSYSPYNFWNLFVDNNFVSANRDAKLFDISKTWLTKWDNTRPQTKPIWVAMSAFLQALDAYGA